MIVLELEYEAFEEVREKCIAAGLIARVERDWDADSQPFTVGGITFKEWKYIPTPEEIARQEEYRKTPLGQLKEHTAEQQAGKFLETMASPNPLLEYLTKDPFVSQVPDGQVYAGEIGSVLRIRMPADYTGKDLA